MENISIKFMAEFTHKEQLYNNMGKISEKIVHFQQIFSVKNPNHYNPPNESSFHN